MHLKSLTCKGFKSFADKVSLGLEPGITAVVGPNGSGKSNISDAVLWVLGERNAKNLRGSAMEDVIFAGSSARRATSVAEVELVLDNSDGTLPVDFNEVVIARRMYRTGESEYLINGTQARRMDVLDILHDSGLGAGTHSIISQGSIDSVLASKPEDRRTLIEEAAGVLKHKQRLAKSARKLERMQVNVDRAGDVVAEVARQLGPLERKAKRAKKYGELAGELAQAKLLLAVDDLRAVQSRYDEIEASEVQLETLLAQRRDAVASVDAEVQELQRKMREVSENAGEAARKQRDAASAAEHIGSTVAVIRDRRRASLARANEVEIELQSSIASISRFEDELERAKANYAESSSVLAEAQARANTLKAQLESAQSKKSTFDSKMDSLAQTALDIEANIAKTREEKVLTQESLARSQAHLKVLEGHAAELEIMVERSSADAKAAQAEAAALEETLAAMEQQEREARTLVATCTRARQAAQEALDEANAAEQSIKAQIAALDAIEKKRANADDARAWFEQNKSSLAMDAHPLSHAVKVDKGLEGIVELLLGKDVDAIALESEDDVRSVIRTLKADAPKGEITFIPLMDKTRKLSREANANPASKSAVAPREARDLAVANEEKGAGQNDMRRLIDSLTYAPSYAGAIEALLGDVVVCDSIDAAIAAHETDDGTHRFVVADGSIVWPSGKVAVGLTVLDEDQGTLARIRQLDELRDSLEAAMKITEEAQTRSSEAQHALQGAQSESLKLSEKLAEMRGSVQSSRSLAQAALAKLESNTRELEDAGRAKSEAEGVIADAKPDAARLDERLIELQKALDAANAERDEIAAKLAPLNEEANHLAQQLQEAKLASAKASERNVYDKMMVERHVSDLHEAKEGETSARNLLSVKRGSAHRLEEIALVFDLIESSARKLASRLEEDAAAVQSSTSGMHARSEELSKRSREAQAALDEITERLGETRIEKARLEMQVRSSVEEIVDGCSMPLEAALKLDPLDNRAQVEEDAQRLEKRIAGLGTINPDAAEEYDELKERYDYLSGQLSDLTQAARSLSKINRMIESRMKDDFVRTFEEINTNFQDVFSMLFPGGSAHLSLEDPENLEDTGVEVNAQPAGKRISKMSLMSGGEKSLTALALLFALYRTRPTPFYILDEVEAALDDTNLRRLTGFIDAMRDTTQLIMITHQRRTMEMADVLFGVSMGADGVTKVISQKLENALRHAE